MFSGQDARVLALVPDYKVNLIAPALIEDEDFGKFQSSLKEVLSFIKYARDKDELKRYWMQTNLSAIWGERKWMC